MKNLCVVGFLILFTNLAFASNQAHRPYTKEDSKNLYADPSTYFLKRHLGGMYFDEYQKTFPSQEQIQNAKKVFIKYAAAYWRNPELRNGLALLGYETAQQLRWGEHVDLDGADECFEKAEDLLLGLEAENGLKPSQKILLIKTYLYHGSVKYIKTFLKQTSTYETAADLYSLGEVYISDLEARGLVTYAAFWKAYYLHYRASIHYRKKEFPQGIKLVEESFKLQDFVESKLQNMPTKTVNFPGLTEVLSLSVLNKARGENFSQLARLYRDSGDLQKGIEYSHKELELKIAVSGADNAEVGVAYTNLGKSYRELKEEAKAKECLEKALQIFKKIYNNNPNHPEMQKIESLLNQTTNP